MKKEEVPPIFSKEEAMPEFITAFMGGGSYIQAQCGHCGRVYFTDGKGDFEPGEYENLLALQKENPEKYIESEYGCIDYGYIDGKLCVFECKCNAGKKYQDFILGHAYQIANFLKKYAEKKIREAKEAKDIADNAGKN